ncbi:MAG: PbpA [Desulfobacteraceae bacterium]|nr:PbpA [Desulfobacteraceae bacterium]
MDPSLLFNAETPTIVVNRDIERYTIETTLDPAFQRFLTARLERLKTLTRGKPQRIGMVAMEPATGKIVAMAGFDLADPGANPCTMGNYPAASVFKIVTASAAVESMGYTPQTPMYFNGGKYTLYKRQLTDKRNRYTTRVPLAKAFAESINPVFGKLASTRLHKEKLRHYAGTFGFNREVDSDFPFDAGKILFKDSSYQLAEVGCGFNKTTTISPMFGAMLSAAIVNRGKSPLPSLVKTVTDANGAVIYTNKPGIFGKAIEPETAKAVMTMMERTITSGTARKSFRRFSRDSTLSRLEIGGKTGSLYNKDNTVKYDWFTGFAKEKNGDKALALAVVVGHRKYIGTRAASYGKMMFKHYFKSYFASNQTTINNG